MRPLRGSRPNKLLLLRIGGGCDASVLVGRAGPPAGLPRRFLKVTGEMVASAQAENGVLAYQRFISEDGQTIYVHERYEDSGAAIEHLRAFVATFDERYASMVERKRFVVFGDPSDELRALLNGYGAPYHRPFGSFPYWG